MDAVSRTAAASMNDAFTRLNKSAEAISQGADLPAQGRGPVPGQGPEAAAAAAVIQTSTDVGRAAEHHRLGPVFNKARRRAARALSQEAGPVQSLLAHIG